MEIDQGRLQPCLTPRDVSSLKKITIPSSSWITIICSWEKSSGTSWLLFFHVKIFSTSRSRIFQGHISKKVGIPGNFS
nr:hypothetical protein [Methanobacterium formicicum]